MKKTKILVTICVMSAMLALTACEKSSGDELDNTVNSSEITEEIVTEEIVTEESTEQSSSTESATTDEVEDSTNVDESTEIESEELSNVEGLSEIYADLDNRSFSVNGKVYTVGVNTLQDMIDDGVVFDEVDIANASNNLSPNYQSQGFSINLDEYYSVQIFTSNFTEENQTIASCPITEIYLPVNTDKKNEILVFAFPLTITEEELRENSGEPTEFNEYISEDGEYVSHTLEYIRESDVYYGDSGYTFEFANGVLEYLYITFK